MESLAESVNKQNAFAHREPLASVERKTGGGLRRAGGGPFLGALGQVAMPALQDLAKEGIHQLPGLIVKGVKKVGKFFKKLFGFGIIQGGYRGTRTYADAADPSLAYHEFSIFDGKKGPEDFSVQLKPEQIAKLQRQAAKLKGGIRMEDVPRLRERILNDVNFAKKLGSKAKIPHKFYNAMLKGLRVPKKKVQVFY